jgi:hypothetical protein
MISHHTGTNMMEMKTMHEAINELKALSDRFYGPTIRHALHRLTVAQGSEDMETWARNLYTAIALGTDDNAVSLNNDRKTILELAYDLVGLWNRVRDQFGEEAANNFENEIVDKFKIRNIERILGFGLPMDRANALYGMKIPTGNLYGMHWYCDYHFNNSLPYCNYDYSQDLTNEEGKVWQTLLHTYPGDPLFGNVYPGTGTMNKKLYQLLFCKKFGFQRRHPRTFGLWSKPQEAEFVDILTRIKPSLSEVGEGRNDGQIHGRDIVEFDMKTVVLGLKKVHQGLPKGNEFFHNVMKQFILEKGMETLNEDKNFGLKDVEAFLRDERLEGMKYYWAKSINGHNWKNTDLEPLTLEQDLKELKTMVRSPLNTARKNLLKEARETLLNTNNAACVQNEVPCEEVDDDRKPPARSNDNDVMETSNKRRRV